MSTRMDAAMARLDEVLNAPVRRRAPSREYLELKAATVAIDEGVFSAVISTEHVDRERDIVPTAAMVRAFGSWAGSGKRIPLHWNHSSKAEDIIGHIDPASVKAEGGEVIAEGFIDQSTVQGREAWRLVKSGVVGFSFGYLTLDATSNADGTRTLNDIDLFEVSATPAPMNARTRVVGWKHSQALVAKDRDVPTLEELAQRERDLFEDPKQAKLRAEMRNHMRVALGVQPVEEKAAAIDFDQQDRRARELLAEFGHLLDD